MMKLVRMANVGIGVSTIDECYIKYHLSTSYFVSIKSYTS